MITVRKKLWRCCVLRRGSIIRRRLLTLPDSEQKLYGPSSKEITFIGDIQPNSITALKLVSLHFPKAWGFLWSPEQNTLTKTIFNSSEGEREIIYRQLAKKNFTWLKTKASKVERCGIKDDGVLVLGGEDGKKVISEAYKCVGLPPLVSYNSDLVFADLKDKVPMKWIVSDAPVAYNIHPAPPEKRGAGVYIPSLLAGEKEYGITAHYIENLVDTGTIISVRRFPIPEGSTESSLRVLTQQHCLVALEDLLLHMKFTEPITNVATSCHYMWRGKQITRRMARKMAREMAEHKTCAVPVL